MMNCEEFTDNVSDYLEGRVPYGERIGMWLHSVMCVHCRRYLDQMREVVDMMHEVGEQESDQEVSPDVKDDLMNQFRSQHGDGNNN